MQKPTQVVGRRVVAFIIDGLIVAAISAIAWYALTKDVGPGSCIGGESTQTCYAGLGGVLLSRSSVIQAHVDGASFGSKVRRFQ